MRLRALKLVMLVLLLPTCAPRPEAQWEHAQQLWQRRDPAPAYRAFLAIDPRSPAGQRARARLQEADGHYRRALDLLRAGRPGARDALQAGAAVAPMDPGLFLPLARACRAKGLPLPALGFYRKYLNLAPLAPTAPAPTALAAARAEMAALEAELGTELGGVLDAPPAPEDPAGVPGWPLALSAGGAALSLALLWRLRRGERTLERRAREAPELHPRITYLVGALRHELLKHRVGAALAALAALGRGPISAPQRLFLQERLGAPLLLAWEGHLRGLQRALGLPGELRRSDPLFARAHRELRRISRRVAAGRLGDARLLRAAAWLRSFDQALARLVAGLSRTRVDRDLLEQAAAEVRAELGAAPPRAPVELTVEGPADQEGPCWVEVYRADLLLVLRNLLRNAWLAAAQAAPPRRVALDTQVDVLPTGEEIVRLRVRDSSPAPLPQGLPGGPLVDASRGLGLVSTALTLYHGGLMVESEVDDGYRKAVTVWFFRTLDSPAAEDGR